MRKTILICLISALSGVFFSFFFYRLGKRCAEAATGTVRCDTVRVARVDTVRVLQPQYVTEMVVETDTVYVRDTVVVAVPVVQRYYRGDAYEAWISGYRPKLDSLNVFGRTEAVTIVRTEKVREKAGKWAIGVQCGYGWNGRELSPYLGVGIQYNLWRF